MQPYSCLSMFKYVCVSLCVAVFICLSVCLSTKLRIYQLSWQGKLTAVEKLNADVSSVSPSSERIDWVDKSKVFLSLSRNAISVIFWSELHFVLFKSKAEAPWKNGRHASPGQLVKIPSQFNKVVNGPGGDNLRSVSTLTGAEVTRGASHTLHVTGAKKKVEHAEFLLRNKVVRRRHTDGISRARKFSLGKFWEVQIWYGFSYHLQDWITGWIISSFSSQTRMWKLSYGEGQFSFYAHFKMTADKRF